jgi:integrase
MAIVLRRKRDGALSYQVKVKDADGNWFKSTTFDNEVDAKAEESRLEIAKRKGTKSISKDARTVSFSDYAEVWKAENRAEVSDGWKLSQNQMLKDYCIPVLGEMTMIDIGPPEIGKVLNRMRSIGRSSQTIQHVYNLLHRMFRDTVEYYEMLTTNPVRASHHRVKVIKRKRDFLLPEEAWKLLDHVKDDYIGPAVWLQVLAALRVGEAQALKWKSINFTTNQILICATYNKKTKVLQDFPKQEDWEYSPLPPRLKEYLLRLNRRPDDFVVQGPQGGMLKYNTYSKVLKRACREIGVLEMESHELRHTSTEIYQQAGANTEDIRRLLNQKSLTSTRNYIHRTDERLNRIASAIEPTRESKPEASVIEDGKPVSQKVSHLGNKERVHAVEGEGYVH